MFFERGFGRDESAVDVDLRLGFGSNGEKTGVGVGLFFVLFGGLVVLFFVGFLGSAEIDIERQGLCGLHADAVFFFGPGGVDGDDFVDFVGRDFDAGIGEVDGKFGTVDEDAMRTVVGVDDEASHGAIGADADGPQVRGGDLDGFGECGRGEAGRKEKCHDEPHGNTLLWTTHVDGRTDETGEQRMGGGRFGLVFGMELGGDKPGMLGEFKEFDELVVGGCAAEDDACVFEFGTQGVIDFITVPVPFGDFPASENVAGAGTLGEYARISAKSHGAALVGDSLL